MNFHPSMSTRSYWDPEVSRETSVIEMVSNSDEHHMPFRLAGRTTPNQAWMWVSNSDEHHMPFRPHLIDCTHESGPLFQTPTSTTCLLDLFTAFVKHWISEEFQTPTSSTCLLDQEGKMGSFSGERVSNSDEHHMPFRHLLWKRCRSHCRRFKLRRAPHAF